MFTRKKKEEKKESKRKPNHRSKVFSYYRETNLIVVFCTTTKIENRFQYRRPRLHFSVENKMWNLTCFLKPCKYPVASTDVMESDVE